MGSPNRKCQQLLRELKSTVEGLLNSQVANVWDVYGGLTRLHVDVEKIFRHGCQLFSGATESDYWYFVQGLEWLQPDPANSTFILDCEWKAHVPHGIRNDRASIWIYRTLENHSLSQKLSWLLSDKTHLAACYQPDAYLRQEAYAEATLLCLRAVERNQPSLLSEIKPGLFLSTTDGKEYRTHRRCASFPDSHFKSAKFKSGRSFDSATTGKNEAPPKKVFRPKLRAWNSAPSLDRSGKAKATIPLSRTTPSTPSHRQLPTKSAYPFVKSGQPKAVRHIIINNSHIIEHTPRKIASPPTITSAPSSSSAKSPVRSLGSSAPEYGFLSSLSGISGEKDFKKLPKKSFIEDGGMSVLPMATGYFPRPTKGQTLHSFLSGRFAKESAELDRENAHFSISEAVISAFEQIKCKKSMRMPEEEEEERRRRDNDEFNSIKQRIRLRRCEKLEERQVKICVSFNEARMDTTTAEASPASVSSSIGTFSASVSSEGVDDIEIDQASKLSDSMSTSLASLFSEDDIFKRGVPDGASDILSAEGVALSLISRFSEKQLPRASDLEWLISEKDDVPQALLPMPKSWPVNPDDANNDVVMPLRGTMEWAPPRAQVIFTLHPTPNRKELIAKQNYRCAGCGMRVAQQYASKFRYCNYLGRFFCTGCHTNQLAIVPAKVIQKWNFNRFQVSNFSYRLLEQMYADPLFRIFELNKNIARQSKKLQICRKYRTVLSYLKDFVLTCRFADTIQDYLNTEPSYIYNDPDIYSLEDLVNVRNGEMKIKLQYLVELCCKHTAECELCLARGFICEICGSEEIIFPWQLRTVRRCTKCGCCFHTKCWKPGEPCSRCCRITRRGEDRVA